MQKENMDLYKAFKPTVSVILPSFNRQILLERAVKSVINQTFEKWELVIVDDGSTDNSFELIKGFQEKHENIRYIRHSNRQLPLSLNSGISASCGDYITFLGSDDEYSPDHLILRTNYMISHPEIDIIHGGVKIIGNPFVKDKYDLSKEIHLTECVIGGTFFGKRNVFVELKGFKNIRYSEDSEFFERALVSGFKSEKVNYETYIYYRDTPDSICNNISAED